MCGRFVLQSAAEIISHIFRLGRVDTVLSARFNIAPGQDIAIVMEEAGVRSLVACRWGFLPSWAKDEKDGYKMINARAETIAEKPSFRKAFQRQRCLVVADGFYEWKDQEGKKQPVYVKRKDGKPMGFAGLYNLWTGPGGKKVCTSTIITTMANDLLAAVHDRMPVIALPEQFDQWLDPREQDAARLQRLLLPFPSSALELYEVSKRINSPKNDGPENIEPLKDQGQ